MVKVLIADRHSIVKKGIEVAFYPSKNIHIAGQVGNASNLIDFISKQPIDVIILEMDLPGAGGIRILKTLKKDFPLIRILMFSEYPEEIYAISTIRAGADGYLSKKADIALLGEAVDKITSGGFFITNELAQRLAMDESAGKPQRLFKKLSRREIEVLKLLALGKRNKQIAEELNLNDKTVSVYKKKVMKKLGVDNLVDLLQQAKTLDLY